MKTQNIIMDLMSGQLSGTALSKSVEKLGNTDFPKFNSLLKDSIKRNDQRTDLFGNSNKTVNSYKQIPKNKAINYAKQGKVSTDRYEDHSSVNIEEESKSKIKEKAVIKGISELLGISPDELNNILANMNINPTELCNSDICKQTVVKISEAIGLNFEQQNNLSDAVKNINTAVDSMIESFEQNKQVQEDWVRVKGLNIDVINSSKSDFSKISEMLELRVHDLVDVIKETGEVSLDDIALKMKQLMLDINLQKSISDSVGNTGNVNNGKKIACKTNNEDSKHSESDKEVQPLVNLKAPNNEGFSQKDSIQVNNENQIINPNNNTETAKAGETLKTTRFNSEVRIVRNELMSQVVHKAKVMLDGNKSEMFMELKPESLGKLALKVVTENGIVMAKFVAESQQVREVLESNMQMLKDTLEEQGLLVQGFSVSVGQDSEKGYSALWQFEAENKRKLNGIISSETNTELGTLIGESQNTIVNPYELGTSSIDFRA